jgi:hypothetical protein
MLLLLLPYSDSEVRQKKQTYAAGRNVGCKYGYIDLLYFRNMALVFKKCDNITFKLLCLSEVNYQV